MLSAGRSSRFSGTLFKSPLSEVTDAAWDAFVRTLSMRPIGATSEAGGIGSFDILPRRLGELGVMMNMRRGPDGKWTGDFVQPYSAESIRCDAGLQLRIFTLSMREYDKDLVGMTRPPGASRSGCLAILHRGGAGALGRWPGGAFRTTREIFERANNLF